MSLINNKKTVLQVVILPIAVWQFVFQVGYLTKGIEFVVYATTIDDTYYYLQTAYNTNVESR